jgi:TonB family protein
MKKCIALLLLLIPFQFCSAQVAELDQEDQRTASNIGGKKEFRRLFEQELMYPEASLKSRTGGKVELSFIVKADSSIADLKVDRSVNQELDQEAIRIFRLLKWMPAKDIGRPVDTRAYLTFNFQPQKYENICRERGYTAVEYPPGPRDTSLQVYYKVDEYPRYIHGGEAMQELILKNLNYPAEVANRGISGQVVLGFIVEPSGLMSNIRVVKPIGAGCDQEAVRVLQMLKWKPGVKKGTFVRTYMTMPFNFQMTKNFR